MAVDPAARPHSLGVLLRLVHNQFSSAVEEVLAQSGFGGIKPHHANVFSFVPPQGIQVSELSIKAGVRKQTMAQAVEELEKLGYVERRPDPADRRARLVFLTDRGAQVRPLAMVTGQKVEADWAERLGQRELESFRLTLQALL
jgi:DNA-binding MarR family transcriptional regulator